MIRTITFLTTLLCGISFFTIGQQTGISDTLSLKQGYADRVWYDLAEGEQARVAQDQWDLAFSVSGRGSGIRINPATGAKLWLYPKGDSASFGTSLDTSGLQSFRQLYNADTSWSQGAFNANANPEKQVDLGWGVYNPTTHHVVGDSIYVMQLGNKTFKQVWIERLASRTYTFHYADLNGQNAQTATINKNDYSDKAFVYYSLQNNQALDPAPKKPEWQLLFTQYTTFLPRPYPVTGVLLNGSAQAVKVNPVADPKAYDKYSRHTFKDAINTIGFDWKTFDRQERQFRIADSTVYFVKTQSEDIWRVVFTGFGGSASGNFNFFKEPMNKQQTGIAKTSARGSLLKVFPNPVQGSRLTVTYNTPQDKGPSTLLLSDVNGRIVRQRNLPAGQLAQQKVKTGKLEPGMYFLQLQSPNHIETQKVMIR